MDLANRLKQNWKSGLTVALINIPLSISLAVAAQSTPTAGIITAVWAGLVAALFGGSKFNVFGPAGALSGILAVYALSHGASSLPLLAVASGIIILIAFALKLERFLIFIPGNAIQGFTLSVALVIGLGQLNSALGLSKLPQHETFVENLWESLRHVPHLSWPTTIVFLAFLAGLFVLLKLVPKIPGAIFLTPVGILVGYLSTKGIIPFHIETLADRFGDISASLVQPPHLAINIDLLAGAVAVALVAVIETMLSAKIADGMTKTRHNERKEMLGLGLANVASGVMGGLPATAVLARTALNIKSGARDNASSALNAVCTAVISLLLLGYFKYIPMPVIASILVFVALRMVEKEFFIFSWKRDKVNFWMAIVVAFVCIYMDPIYGILTGTVVALFLFVHNISQGHFELWLNSKKEGEIARISGTKLEEMTADTDILTYAISGQLVYINSKAHIGRFESGFGKYQHVILRLRELRFIDRDGVEALSEIIELCHRNNKDVAISGANPEIEYELQHGSEVYRKLKKQGMVFEGSVEALQYFGFSKQDV